jgi:hypothetical protein
MGNSKNTCEPDFVLRERYEQLTAELQNSDQDALLDKLHGSSLFDDLNDDWEHDIGERYRKIKQEEAESGTLGDWGIDPDSLEAKYRKKN